MRPALHRQPQPVDPRARIAELEQQLSRAHKRSELLEARCHDLLKNIAWAGCRRPQTPNGTDSA